MRVMNTFATLPNAIRIVNALYCAFLISVSVFYFTFNAGGVYIVLGIYFILLAFFLIAVDHFSDIDTSSIVRQAAFLVSIQGRALLQLLTGVFIVVAPGWRNQTLYHVIGILVLVGAFGTLLALPLLMEDHSVDVWRFKFGVGQEYIRMMKEPNRIERDLSDVPLNEVQATGADAA
ncbi:hypothetical protein HDU99_005670 [Rhizoclosmatium hyalinum]|nr:hypothetical protein HDU99_005670 [Rhizoclosmatium hyalinum]